MDMIRPNRALAKSPLRQENDGTKAMSPRMTLQTQLVLDPQKRAQALGHYHAVLRRNLAAAAPVEFDFPTQLVGATPDGNVTLYYDPSLGQPGADLTRQILITVARTYADCQTFFNIPGLPIKVIIAAVNNATDGSGGAYHNGCSFTLGGELYCDAAFGNPTLTSGLIVAELTECFMGLQNKGWDCGGSNGEALSRFLAQQTSGGADGVLAEFATGPEWDQAGRPDWIDATDPTDQDVVSTGCGVVYLYWIQSKGFTPAQITQAGCPDGTLRSNYAALTGKTSAWADFGVALAGLSGAIASDDPWQRPPAVPQAAAQPAPSRDQVLIDALSKTVTLPQGWKVLNEVSEAGKK
jgi:hypothetical protein